MDDKYWDEQLQLWINKNGDTYDPNEGFWRSRDRTKVYGGVFGDFWQPAPGGYNSAASQAYGNAPAANGSSQVFNYGWALLEREQAQQTKIENLKAEHEQNLAKINNAAQEALQSGRITAAESQFVRQLAESVASRQSQERIAQAQLELDKMREERQAGEFQQTFGLQERQLALGEKGEARQERALAASLAANPADWITYQNYARQPGNVAGTMGLPPSASDEDIRGVASSLFNPSSAPYNPQLQGTGAFGAKIQAPNTFSRSEVSSLSGSERDMLGGLLKAGVEMGGKKVSVAPDDYWQQVEKSLIPGLSSIKAPTTYRG